MNTSPFTTIVLPLAMSLATAVVVVQWSGHGSAPAAPPPQESAMPAELRDSLARIEQRFGALEERLAATERQAARVALAPPQHAGVQVPAVAPNPLAGAPADATAKPGEAPPLESFLAELAAPELTDDQWTEIWGRLHKAGHLEAALAHFEQMAKDDPRNPDKQVALGAAYLQKLFTVGNGPEAGTWAVKADKTFDRALELDPQHWDARSAKATSLAFWPPIFGKGKEAISHFEILVEQQEAKGFDLPKYAQTYVFLGNLYEQAGEKDKAAEVRARGAKRFPQNKQLSGN